MEANVKKINSDFKEVSFSINEDKVTLKLKGSRTMKDLTNLLYALATGIEGKTVPNQVIEDLKY
jgi:hypothetical protein